MSSRNDIPRCVQLALRNSLPASANHERRRERRHPFPYPIRLTPVDTYGNVIGDVIFALGKHIANRGLDFYCQQPIAHRRVVVSFEVSDTETVEMLMELNWCRFSQFGWYENGGRFLSAVNVPV